MKNGSKHLLLYYTTSTSLSKIIRIVMETYKECSAQARNQEVNLGSESFVSGLEERKSHWLTSC